MLRVPFPFTLNPDNGFSSNSGGDVVAARWKMPSKSSLIYVFLFKSVTHVKLSRLLLISGVLTILLFPIRNPLISLHIISSSSVIKECFAISNSYKLTKKIH